MQLLFIGTQELLIIALVVLLLFGGAKIPELMRGMGKGVKSFKDGLNGNEEESQKAESNSKYSQKADSNNKYSQEPEDK
jgi:sec-independent protein translocase protein TatA